MRGPLPGENGRGRTVTIFDLVRELVRIRSVLFAALLLQHLSLVAEVVIVPHISAGQTALSLVMHVTELGN